MKIDKNVVLVAVAAFALAWFMASNQGGGFLPNPFVPARPQRPVLAFLARVAKTFLWVAVFAEPRPDQPPRHHVVQATIGPDGHELLEHGDL